MPAATFTLNNDYLVIVDNNDYVGCVIKDIHRGKTSEGRGEIVYASVYNADGKLLISADMEYIAHVLKSRCPRNP